MAKKSSGKQTDSHFKKYCSYYKPTILFIPICEEKIKDKGEKDLPQSKDTKADENGKTRKQAVEALPRKGEVLIWTPGFLSLYSMRKEPVLPDEVSFGEKYTSDSFVVVGIVEFFTSKRDEYEEAKGWDFWVMVGAV